MKASREATLLKQNKTRIEAMRKKREEIQKAKLKAESDRIAKHKEIQEKKIAVEAGKRKEAEGMVSKLEEEEAKLIEMLKGKQEVQREAYEKLQRTILMENS